MNGFASRFSRGVYHNLSDTPQLAEGVSMFRLLRQFLNRSGSVFPAGELPHNKMRLETWTKEKPTVTWFGHSSYLINNKGFNILVDPVFSGTASPFSFYLKAFRGSDVYKVEDMPPIDLLLLTHNHYDHLDLQTVRALAPTTKRMVMPLGVSRHLRGVPAGVEVTELDWWQGVELGQDMHLVATPARHFSGRGLRRNQSLWASFALTLGPYRIFIGSDSGYDTHFKKIGDELGPFHLALLECGQYNDAWPLINSMPEELVQEGADLRAQVVMPVHWGKFALAFHDWKEPAARFVKAAREAGIQYTTPLIGQPVVVDVYYPRDHWWENV